jgi:hypothetical protein
VGTQRLDAKVNVIYLTVNRDDSATKDGLQNDLNSPKDELASHVHLTQVHNLITRVSGQLDRVRGEQRYFRARCDPDYLLLFLMHSLWGFVPQLWTDCWAGVMQVTAAHGHQ